MDEQHNKLMAYVLDEPEQAAREIERLRKIESAHHLTDWALDDIKRLVREATRGEDGEMPVTRDNTWPLWVGSAKAHLAMLVENVEKSRK